MKYILTTLLFAFAISNASAQNIYYKGSKIGVIQSDGDVYYRGSEVGEIQSDGDVYYKGSQIGTAKGVDPAHAAVFFFFFKDVFMK